MSGFNLQAKGVFGRYCKIEMYRYGVPNEFFIHKCIGQYKSMTYCDVPLRGGFEHEATKHPITSDLPFPDYLEDVVLVVQCGLDETHVFPVALKDIELLDEDFNVGCEFQGTGSDGYPFCASAMEISLLRDEKEQLRAKLRSWAAAFDSFATENGGCGRRMDAEDWLELANDVRMDADVI